MIEMRAFALISLFFGRLILNSLFLILKCVQFLDIDRVTVTVNGDDQGQTNGCLGRSHSQHKCCPYHPYGTIGRQISPESDEIDIYRVEHQLNAHQDGNGIASRQHTEQAHRE